MSLATYGIMVVAMGLSEPTSLALPAMTDASQIPDTQFRLRTLFIATGTCAVAFAVMARWPMGLPAFLPACVPAFWVARALLLLANALTRSNHRAAIGTMNLLGAIALCLLFAVLATLVACVLWALIWLLPSR